MSLTDIGRKNFTEKANLGFLDIYEDHWKALKDQPITLLEIGVYNGNSIKTWLDYFPNAIIIGIDINPQPYVHDISRATLLKGDQADIHFLNSILKGSDGFDIIIDDGGHHWDEQQISLNYLWPHVKNGGMYIIEDLQTSNDIFWRGKDVHYTPTSEFLGELVDVLCRAEKETIIASMHIYPRLCILRKK